MTHRSRLVSWNPISHEQTTVALISHFFNIRKKRRIISTCEPYANLTCEFFPRRSAIFFLLYSFNILPERKKKIHHIACAYHRSSKPCVLLCWFSLGMGALWILERKHHHQGVPWPRTIHPEPTGESAVTVTMPLTVRFMSVQSLLRVPGGMTNKNKEYKLFFYNF